MLTYGLKKGTKDVLLHIDSVANGLKCGCECPNCGCQLMAKNGGDVTKRGHKSHHFAHANGSEECGKGRMTALHIMAQNILSERKTILLPPYKGTYVQKEAQIKAFKKVIPEDFSKVEDIVLRPDCNCLPENPEAPTLWVEIYCRHKVDDVKKKKIKHRNQYCVEVDFRDLLDVDYTEDDVIRRLEEESGHKEWICCPVWDKEEEELCKRKVEADRLKREEELKHEQEVANAQSQLTDIVNAWYNGKTQNGSSVIQKIRDTKYDEEVNIYDILVPYNDYSEFIRKSPKDISGLKVFYELLHFYYSRVSRGDFRVIIFALNRLTRNRKELSAEGKIELEEWMSIRIIYLLCRAMKTYSGLNEGEEFKTCIKKYIDEPDFRNMILKLVSVYSRHVVGSKARNFGELTKEIIQSHPDLTKLYLTLVQSHEKDPNDYTLDGRDMLLELRKIANNNQIEANKYVEKILKTCYRFAFMYTPTAEPIPSISEPVGFNKELAGKNEGDLWRELNDKFQK